MNSAAATTALAPAHTYGFGVHVNENSRRKAHGQFQLGILFDGKLATTTGGSWKMAARRRSSLLVISRDVSEAGKMNNQRKKKEKDDKKDMEDHEEDGRQLQQQLPSSSVSVMKRLDDVNPVGLGRRSRQIFDEVWRKFSGLGQISMTTRDNDETSLLIREGGPMCEFSIPGAQNTTVLVVGATSRVGRIVVRKLMLRGYTVKVVSSATTYIFIPHFCSFFATKKGLSKAFRRDLGPLLKETPYPYVLLFISVCLKGRPYGPEEDANVCVMQVILKKTKFDKEKGKNYSCFKSYFLRPN